MIAPLKNRTIAPTQTADGVHLMHLEMTVNESSPPLAHRTAISQSDEARRSVY